MLKSAKFVPVISRDTDIRKMIKFYPVGGNKPVLIGNPGVSKTAVFEGLAQRIASGGVPETLKIKNILILALAGILTGSKFRGDFEKSLKIIVSEIDKAGWSS